MEKAKAYPGYKYGVIRDDRKYGELYVKWHDKYVILTDEKTIYRDDWSKIALWMVDYVDDECSDVPDMLYEISYMPDGYSLVSVIVDHDAVIDLMAGRQFLEDVIGGCSERIRSAIERKIEGTEWFE